MKNEPVLSSSIQGNVLAAFNKSYQHLVGLRITDVRKTKAWLSSVVPQLAPHDAVARFNAAFSLLRKHRLGVESDDITATWRHLAFSYEGLSLLTDDLAGFEPAFVQGQFGRAVSELGDLAGHDHVHPDGWLVGSTPANTPHILAIIAADNDADRTAAVARFKGDAQDATLTVVYDEDGTDLEQYDPAMKGHEHFGFKDGISQPGVRGAKADGSYFMSRPAGQTDINFPEFALPGQPLIWPGQFVFGYPAQDTSDMRAPKITSTPVPAWTANGSYLVFRRLSQKVYEFRNFINELIVTVGANPAYAGIDGLRIGAMIVGRWASGAPIEIASLKDAPLMATDPNRNNAFNYYTQPNQDIDGKICPVFAHVRKVNPRDQSTDLGGQPDTLTRRIMRRGIPFGPPLAAGAIVDDGIERGLLFLAHMTSIQEQFEKLVTDWMNVNDRPSPTGNGFDMLVGQNPAVNRTREADLAGTVITTMRDFVVATGGGYFFSPSFDAIRTTLAG